MLTINRTSDCIKNAFMAWAARSFYKMS